MGIFKYIVQGFGWEIGSQAARRGIQTLEERAETAETADEQPPSQRELRRRARAAEKQAARERKEREEAIARNKQRIEEELRALKKKAER